MTLRKGFKRIKSRDRINKDTNRNELAIMAQDPQIQAELNQIQQEFAATDFDGL